LQAVLLVWAGSHHDDRFVTEATPLILQLRRMISMAVSVRYIVNDVVESLKFYTQHLGFALQQDASPAFASVTRGDLRLLLSGPGSSGAKPTPDGERPAPGGWNRILLIVLDLREEVDKLQNAGVQFRNEIIAGVGGSQILLKDPSGNFVELFQPVHHE
jgi:predicted enzyme related to lactoylglutathione lyase